MQKAAGHGDAKAQSFVALFYKTGEGVEQNYVKALEWYRRAAQQGEAHAQTSLGLFYERGVGVPKNAAAAAKWFRAASCSATC